jgi:hypothetical protein
MLARRFSRDDSPAVLTFCDILDPRLAWLRLGKLLSSAVRGMSVILTQGHRRSVSVTISRKMFQQVTVRILERSFRGGTPVGLVR